MRGKLLTWFVVLFTVVLAGIAIFTAIKLYQQRQVSVAPTAPTSIPRAAETTQTTTACNPTTFNIAAPKCGDTCGSDGQCPTDHTCSNTKCVLTSCLASGATCDTTKCNLVTPASCNNTCSTDKPCSSGLTCDTTTGTCRNPSCNAETDCLCATPAPLVCGDSCTSTTQCPSDHQCSGGKCVLTSCVNGSVTCSTNNCSIVTATPAPGCGSSCTANSQCPSDHTCSGNKCVLTSCLNAGTTCNSSKCSVVTATPAPSLPVAGNGTPTIIFGVLGFLTIVGALAIIF